MNKVTIACDCGEVITGTAIRPFACPTCMQVYSVKISKAFEDSKEEMK